MDSEDIILTIMIVCVVGIVFCVGALTGYNSCQKEALKAGVAYYTVDTGTGETKFNWGKKDE